MAAPRRSKHGWARWVGLAFIALLAVQAVRNAIVRSDDPEQALGVWPGHPDALFAKALTGIGIAAREGRRPAPEHLRAMEHGARAAPLAPEPLWVAATARMEAGDLHTAELLLKTAVRLDPRAPAARFLLADLHVRQGRLTDAMADLAALERRLPGISADLVPSFVRFLRQPAAAAKLGPALQASPPLRNRLLETLSGDPGAGRALLELARPGDQDTPWFGKAIEALLTRGDIVAARRLHARVLPGASLAGGLQPWRASSGTSALGWRFPAGRGGVAEPVEGGPLRLIHYGREDSGLAEHLLLLTPGRYRLTQRFAADVAEPRFEWRLTCLRNNRVLALVPAGRTSDRGLLTVPADCQVQKLTLVARPSDVAETVSAELLEVAINRAESGNL